MNYRKQDSFYSETGALTTIEVALVFPIVLVTFIFIINLVVYLRASAHVWRATEKAAEVASSAEVRLRESLDSGAAPAPFLVWTPTGTLPDFNSLTVETEQCRNVKGWPDTNAYTNIKACVDTQVQAASAGNSNPRVAGIVWNGFSNTGLARQLELPFSLYERDSTVPSYSPVQKLPLIGIKKGCFEPFNETAANIGTNCSLVKPLYYYSPEYADFDADGKEDIVFFKPQDGTDAATKSNWGFRADDAADFIVYMSSGAYNALGGMMFFNLSTTADPADLPIVADYDGDGATDFGIFSPTTGKVRIAFSKTRWSYVFEGSMGVSETGQKGLIAVPGKFDSAAKRNQVLVMQTGGTAVARYNMFISSPITPTDNELQNSSYVMPAIRTVNSSSFKPHRGMSAVPVFGDINDDGATEIGFMSYPGGNIAQQVGGLTKGTKNGFATVAEFPASSSAASAMDIRMNPFHIETASGLVYYSDAVDGTIWSAVRNSTDGTLGAVSLVMGSSNIAHRPFSEAIFPKENVWNIPSDASAISDCDTACPALTAGNRKLKTPRRFTIGKDGDMYVADFGGMRIIRVQASAGVVDSSSPTTVILGSQSCVGGGCTALTDTTVRGATGNFTIYPIAIEAVPQTAAAAYPYDIVFSTGYAVYLYKNNANPGGGPTGDPSDVIYRIAGKATGPANLSNANPSISERYIETDGTAVFPSLGLAKSAGICPIVDLTMDLYTDTGFGAPMGAGSRYTVLAASSCSLNKTASNTWDPATTPYTNVGGIIRLIPGSSFGFSMGAPTAKVIAGSFAAVPCGNAGGGYAECSAPSASSGNTDAGIYQRKIDLNNKKGGDAANGDLLLTDVDIINPAAIELDWRGNILFINQWNESKRTDYIRALDQTSTSTAGIDRQHNTGVYRVNLESATMEAVTNPLDFGSNTIPVQSADWFSPYHSTDGEYYDWIEAQPAPVKSQPVPATAALALSQDRKHLYTSTPFLANPTAYGCPGGHPYCVEAERVGFIYSIAMDTDGDGVFDSTDTDIDGDGVLNTVDLPSTSGTPPGRSLYCPEVYASLQTHQCRMQEKVGLPRVYMFSKADDTTTDQTIGITNGSGFTATQSVKYVEYDLINSVSEFHTDNSNGSVNADDSMSRPEPWATLFNWGENGGTGGTFCTTRSGDISSPYYDCANTANGPIVALNASHGFVGAEGAYSPIGNNEIRSLSGLKFQNGRYAALVGPYKPDQYLGKLPTVFSSTRPRENGIKPVRKPSIATLAGLDSKTNTLLRPGELCWYYPHIKIENINLTPLTAQQPFMLDFSNYLGLYHWSGIDVGEDISTDTDILNYIASCSSVSSPTLDDSRTAAIEGLILQLDHDDTGLKLTEGDVNWPHPIITGRHWDTGIKDAENKRDLFLIDLDGKGVRKPAWLTTEVMNSDGTHAKDVPFSLISTGNYFDYDLNKDPFAFIDMRYSGARYPFSDPGFSGLLNLGTGSGYPTDVAAVSFNDSGFFYPTFAKANSRIFSPSSNYFRSAFDYGKVDYGGAMAVFGATVAYDYSSTMFIGLDFNYWIPRTVKNTTSPASGATMFANYSRNNRFRTVNGKQPPALTSAQNLLSAGLGLNPATDWVSTPAALTPGKAYFMFKKKDAVSGVIRDCQTYTDNSLSGSIESCDYVEISYMLQFMGRSVTITRDALITLPVDNRELCDPSAAGVWSGRCTAPLN